MATFFPTWSLYWSVLYFHKFLSSICEETSHESESIRKCNISTQLYYVNCSQGISILHTFFVSFLGPFSLLCVWRHSTKHCRATEKQISPSHNKISKIIPRISIHMLPAATSFGELIFPVSATWGYINFKWWQHSHLCRNIRLPDNAYLKPSHFQGMHSLAVFTEIKPSIINRIFIFLFYWVCWFCYLFL